MLDILPIKSIRPSDAILVGEYIYKLSLLKHSGYPVPDGIVVLPPEFKLRTILEHYNFKHKEVFEQSLTIIKKLIRELEAPQALREVLIKKKLDAQELWLSMLDLWLSEIRNNFWKTGFSHGLSLNLSSQPIFFVEKVHASGSAYFDDFEGIVIVKVTSGELKESERDKIAALVKKGNSKLVIPMTYHFILEGKKREPRIIKLSPQVLPSSEIPGVIRVESEQTTKPKSALKVFLNPGASFISDFESDGMFIEADSQSNEGSVETIFDRQVMQMSEASLFVSNSNVIFKLSDKHADSSIRGATRLLHDKTLLKTQAQAFLFARNKKGLNNISICIPYLRSSSELAELKRELLSFGVARKGNLQIWTEFDLLENLLNIDEYLKVGFDGCVLNLDEMLKSISGIDVSLMDSSSLTPYLSALTNILEAKLKTLHREKIPVLVVGKSVQNDDLLEFLIDKGIFGVILTKEYAGFIRDHLRFIENRIVRKRLG